MTASLHVWDIIYYNYNINYPSYNDLNIPIFVGECVISVASLNLYTKITILPQLGYVLHIL